MSEVNIILCSNRLFYASFTFKREVTIVLFYYVSYLYTCVCNCNSVEYIAVMCEVSVPNDRYTLTKQPHIFLGSPFYKTNKWYKDSCFPMCCVRSVKTYWADITDCLNNIYTGYFIIIILYYAVTSRIERQLCMGGLSFLATQSFPFHRGPTELILEREGNTVWS